MAWHMGTLASTVTGTAMGVVILAVRSRDWFFFGLRVCLCMVVARVVLRIWIREETGPC